MLVRVWANKRHLILCFQRWVVGYLMLVRIMERIVSEILQVHCIIIHVFPSSHRTRMCRGWWCSMATLQLPWTTNSYWCSVGEGTVSRLAPTSTAVRWWCLFLLMLRRKKWCRKELFFHEQKLSLTSINHICAKFLLGNIYICVCCLYLSPWMIKKVLIVEIMKAMVLNMFWNIPALTLERWTHGGLYKMTAIFQMTVWMHFLEWKYMNFD